ncbi:MAG: hypothetical protein SPL30_06990 [Succinivibrio sp.]|jgi:hypothetical protein|nr:hypothetical protein [Succinivibrio sp.]
MKFNRAAAYAAGFLFMLAGFPAPAYNGDLSAYEESGDWFSAYFDHEGVRRVRMGTQAASDSNIFLNIDFDEQSRYKALVNLLKPNDEKGKVVYENPVNLPCQIRIDRNEIFDTTCQFGDDENNDFLDLGSELGLRFMQESAQGEFLRIKVTLPGDTGPEYIRFSLQGFEGAFNRLKQLWGQYFDSSNADAQDQKS